MYLATVARLISMPSLSSSPWLETLLLAQEADFRGEIEQQVLVNHRRIFVEVLRILPERGEARFDPQGNRVMLSEVGARMRQDHDSARLAPGRL
jgi:hypothetical protein